MSKFANAIGIWDIKINGIDFDLKPKMKDVRHFRNILVNDDNRKNKNLLYDKFADFLYSMIKESFPNEKDEDIKDFIEININTLFEESMVAFRWTTKEEMLKQKQEGLSELKKQMSNV